MWFWIGLALVIAWGAWGYARRRWWLREIDRSLGRAQRALSPAAQGSAFHYQPPQRLVVSDQIVTALAGAAAIIGLFLIVGSRWGWFA